MSYWVHSNPSESLAFVSTYISQQEQVHFTGTWMLTAVWRDVPEYLGNTGIVNCIASYTTMKPLWYNYYFISTRQIPIKGSLSQMGRCHLHCSHTTVIR